MEHLRGRWVPIAELAKWLASELRYSPRSGSVALLNLVREGRLERRRTGPEDGWPAYEYRATDAPSRPAGHSGRPRVQRRIAGLTPADRQRARILELISGGSRSKNELVLKVPCAKLTLGQRVRELQEMGVPVEQDRLNVWMDS